MTTLRTNIRQLVSRHPEGLRISPFQRHYVWGTARQGQRDAVTFLTESLATKYIKATKRQPEADNKPDWYRYFLQSITVKGDILVDGQQRLTYLILLLKHLLGTASVALRLRFDNRPQAERWLDECNGDDTVDDPDETSQDIYLYKSTLRIIADTLGRYDIDADKFAQYVMDNVEILYIELPTETGVMDIYRMMNDTKAPMLASDIIKADLMRMASDPTQPNTYDWELNILRSRYANEWDTYVRWWNRIDVQQYYKPLVEHNVDLLLKLCLRTRTDDVKRPLTYEEFRLYIANSGELTYHAAKHIFYKIRSTQRRIVEAFDNPTTYNQIRAILLLSDTSNAFKFVYDYFVNASIDSGELDRYYRLSFLGMTIDEIAAHQPVAERFDDMLASLSMADVYHSEAKRDVFNLLLRLNIDEDTKLGRKFDFDVWSNRSLEHIYSKSKVWHFGKNGRVLDGNDNDLGVSRQHIERDQSFMRRDIIVNHDGTPLSEHCIGNLVLLYGQNNAAFGNAGFEQKKVMFLDPGNTSVFKSRNLLHSVCVFSGNRWDHQSIIDNYNQTLKSLKAYYEGIVNCEL